MIEIKYLRAESGANKFGTCNCCGKSSSEDPLMISVKFSYYGHGTLICLCDDCKKKLMEALPPAKSSETPNSSDTISRKAAITAIDNCECDGEDSCGQPWIYKENAVETIEMVEPLQPAQPERIRGHWVKISPANIYECSECGKHVMTNDICAYDFCHGCGAEMEVTT